MKPPKSVRPLSDLRVTRKTNIHVGHSDSHGWAVSYADLLMVLLSFFVLYFSFADENPATVNAQMQRLALSMKGLSTEQIDKATRKPDSVAFSSLAEALKIKGIHLTQHEDFLLIELEEGAFASADFKVRPDLRAQIDAVYDRLEPFKSNLSLTIIGHADKRPLAPRNAYLRDNFDLSSMRALTVLKYVLKKGFPENQAAARAASSFDRDARSVTFEVRLASVNPGEGTKHE